MFAKTLLTLSLIVPLAAEVPAIATDGLSPQDALKHMQVPDGFAVDLVAGEPAVVQPIAMCFDARGRLWVAEGLTYPKRAPEGQGEDKILIFEDTDGDGTFDSRKVFAEHLNLVSGLEVGFGGVFVGAAPYLLFIPDKDGDDQPDGAPQVLLDGFGYQDTHETLNSFIWGPDGCLWGCHGIFTNSRVGAPGTPDGQRVPLNAGVWKFDPRTKKFEVVAHGTSNPWGLDFNDWGDAFVEACVIPHLWHIIPGGHYERQAGSDFNPAIYDPIKTIADHLHYTGNIADHAHWNGREGGVEPASVSEAGGGHAHSGFAICLSDAFPKEFRNDAFFFNIHGHRMNHDLLVRNGSGWTGKHGKDLVMSYDQWFLGVS
ncbi:MAG: putative rane-bound dehydrogenase domain protein, partial [Akkermansiaceae bacterium]|nr:putative rane-bound dehydrogenase domain protein [Akkermansiaceae bacterium]